MAEPLLPGTTDKAKPFEELLNKRLGLIKTYGDVTKDWPADVRQLGMFAIPGLFDAETLPWEEQQKRLGWYLGEQEKAAVKKAEMNKAANDRALLSTVISKFGDNIGRAIGGPSWDTIERNRSTGFTAINNIPQSTLQPLSTAQFQSRNYYS